MDARAYPLISLYLTAALTVAACAPIRQNEVWNSYDVRHPVPADSKVPDHYAHQYDQYIDNDTYYSLPLCTGITDSPACLTD